MSTTFDFIDDNESRSMYETAYQAISNTNNWDFVKQPIESFMWSQDPKIWQITSEIQRLGYNEHSGASFGFTMRTMQYIANHGLEQFKCEYLDKMHKLQVPQQPPQQTREQIIAANITGPTNYTVVNDQNEVFHGSYLTYSNTDVYAGMENRVLPRETEFDNVILEAVRFGCNVIVKKGGGQWYLKGYGKDYDDTKQRIEDNLVAEAEREPNAKTHKNVQVWLLKIRVGIAVFN